eukprot:TRINITY_DN2548_c0_g2_i1.p1 TRINITY_DN2548_c0_g2~~TRINITY_DN2548_c0_g2_i1.p1  ORF type:complete len:1360 (+),score=475.48 TRINITY_DN2548_c0_g2_i1:104-4183(+)
MVKIRNVLFEFLRYENTLTDDWIKEKTSRYVIIKDEYISHMENGTVVYNFCKHISKKYNWDSIGIPNIKNLTTPAAKLYNWKRLIEVLYQMFHIKVEDFVLDLIISGDVDIILDLLNEMKSIVEERLKIRKKLNLDVKTPPIHDFTKVDTVENVDIFEKINVIEEIDCPPMRDVSNVLDMLIVSLSTNFNLSSTQALYALTAKLSGLRFVLEHGVQGSINPIVGFLTMLNEHIDILAKCVKEESPSVLKYLANLLSACFTSNHIEIVSTSTVCMLELVIRLDKPQLKVVYDWLMDITEYIPFIALVTAMYSMELNTYVLNLISAITFNFAEEFLDCNVLTSYFKSSGQLMDFLHLLIPSYDQFLPITYDRIKMIYFIFNTINTTTWFPTKALGIQCLSTVIIDYCEHCSFSSSNQQQQDVDDQEGDKEMIKVIEEIIEFIDETCPDNIVNDFDRMLSMVCVSSLVKIFMMENQREPDDDDENEDRDKKKEAGKILSRIFLIIFQKLVLLYHDIIFKDHLLLLLIPIIQSNESSNRKSLPIHLLLIILYKLLRVDLIGEADINILHVLTHSNDLLHEEDCLIIFRIFGEIFLNNSMLMPLVINDMIHLLGNYGNSARLIFEVKHFIQNLLVRIQNSIVDDVYASFILDFAFRILYLNNPSLNEEFMTITTSSIDVSSMNSFASENLILLKAFLEAKVKYEFPPVINISAYDSMKPTPPVTFEFYQIWQEESIKKENIMEIDKIDKIDKTFENNVDLDVEIDSVSGKSNNNATIGSIVSFDHQIHPYGELSDIRRFQLKINYNLTNVEWGSTMFNTKLIQSIILKQDSLSPRKHLFRKVKKVDTKQLRKQRMMEINRIKEERKRKVEMLNKQKEAKQRREVEIKRKLEKIRHKRLKEINLRKELSFEEVNDYLIVDDEMIVARPFPFDDSERIWLMKNEEDKKFEFLLRLQEKLQERELRLMENEEYSIVKKQRDELLQNQSPSKQNQSTIYSRLEKVKKLAAEAKEQRITYQTKLDAYEKHKNKLENEAKESRKKNMKEKKLKEKLHQKRREEIMNEMDKRRKEIENEREKKNEEEKLEKQKLKQINRKKAKELEDLRLKWQQEAEEQREKINLKQKEMLQEKEKEKLEQMEKDRQRMKLFRQRKEEIKHMNEQSEIESKLMKEAEMFTWKREKSQRKQEREEFQKFLDAKTKSYLKEAKEKNELKKKRKAKREQLDEQRELREAQLVEEASKRITKDSNYIRRRQAEKKENYLMALNEKFSVKREDYDHKQSIVNSPVRHRRRVVSSRKPNNKTENEEDVVLEQVIVEDLTNDLNNGIDVNDHTDTEQYDESHMNEVEDEIEIENPVEIPEQNDVENSS